MVEYIRARANFLAKQRPYCEIIIQKKSGPPKLEAFYSNNTVEELLTPRWKMNEIEAAVNRMCDASGAQNKNRRFPKKVLKGAGSAIDKVLPSWNPFHADRIFRP